MSRWSLFGGRFDHDAADCRWSEQDELPECPFCGERVEAGPRGLVCDNCEMQWDALTEIERDRAAVRQWPPEVE